jgi:hypothetical protein
MLRAVSGLAHQRSRSAASMLVKIGRWAVV